MAFFIDFPFDWAGVPPFGETERWSTPEAWAKDLLDELAAGADVRLRKSQRKVLHETFVFEAVEGIKREASRTFLSLATWYGPLTSADAYITPREALGAISLEDYVGANDPSAAEPPEVGPFTTQSGLVGVRCVRYINPYDNSPVIGAVIEYAFEVDGSVLRLLTSQLDLVNFPRTIELMDGLAGSVTSV
ncbi:hypothetical protein B0I08_105278 [Glaciihabitans tibetensis]|uniref:Uncharacterized protein n=1 Tax=Glaciihabitans tibetensis TaxID=1266600 RepID=A0A2T0VD71_9MICO|nr:hypothetical protein [Glaciihabitans tibetensis]PRY68113.1 hypothetical protein B0I08_105278 [Glaciihabitans tibetensis]